MMIIARLLATVVYIGYIPIAPGTWGSLTAVAFLYVLKPVIATQIALILSLFLAGVWSANKCETNWGKDPGRIVIDEFVGQMISLLFVPLTAINTAAGFLLFRFFDILKPPPIRNIEGALSGGWAVMLDDVAAGIAANLCLQALIFLFS